MDDKTPLPWQNSTPLCLAPAPPQMTAFDDKCRTFFSALVSHYGTAVVSNYMHWIGALHFSKCAPPGGD